MKASSCVFSHKYVSSPTDKFRKLCGFKEKGGCLSKKCVIFKTQVAISALVKNRPESCRLEAICTYHGTLQIAQVPGEDSGSRKSCRGIGSQCTLELTVHKDPGQTTPLFFLPLQSSRPQNSLSPSILLSLQEAGERLSVLVLSFCGVILKCEVTISL